ncbi:hypothetical protein PFISCL1PPCAC_5733, partial [Pristionchus fissidentatus]
NMVALYFYSALSQFKQELFGPAEDTLKEFMKVCPDSPAALNLYNCIKFRSNKPVNMDITSLSTLYPSARLLFKHNHVIFTGGTNALQVLPTLIDDVPEALLNLTIYHLNRDDYDAAFKLIDPYTPTTPYGFLLKAIVCLLIGQTKFNGKYMMEAREYFQQVGTDRNITNTLNGRLAMSAYFFLAGLWDDCIWYLLSVKDLFELDDRYNLNYGQALVMNERYADAINVLNLVNTLRTPLYTQFLVKAYVMNGQAQHAWDVFMKVRNSNESAVLLKIIAEDSCKTRQFYSMVRAYDALEKIDPSPDHWIGKRAAVSGQFIQLVKGNSTGKEMSEVLQYLQNGNHSQIESITRTIASWCANNGVQLS